MDKGKIFMNGKSQAVRLPKKFRFDSEEVLILEHPAGVLLMDPKKKWDYLKTVVEKFSDDLFEDGRDEWTWKEREDL